MNISIIIIIIIIIILFILVNNYLNKYNGGAGNNGIIKRKSEVNENIPQIHIHPPQIGHQIPIQIIEQPPPIQDRRHYQFRGIRPQRFIPGQLNRFEVNPLRRNDEEHREVHPIHPINQNRDIEDVNGIERPAAPRIDLEIMEDRRIYREPRRGPRMYYPIARRPN